MKTILARIFLFAAAVIGVGFFIINFIGDDSPVGFSLSFVLCTCITLIIIAVKVLRYAFGKGQKLSENISTKSEIQKKIKSVEYKIRSYEEIEKTGTMTADEKSAWRELAHEHLRLTRELGDLS